MKSICTGWWAGLLLLAILCVPTAVQASHVRAGEITTRRISNTSLTYEITLTTYYDILTGGPAADAAKTALFCFGDGSRLEVPRQEPIRKINSATTINIYRTIHTYSGPGTYSISGLIRNRNNMTRNINGGDSQKVNFFVTTTISAIPILGLNSTPVLLNPPVDSARIGQKYCHNPAAYDADGDSLAYRIATPQQSNSELNEDPNACQSFPVTRYQLPQLVVPPGKTENGVSGATFTVNAKTGDVCWDAPVEAGQYNYAFIIEEWRNGVLIGEITRDVQVVVVDGPNRRPLLDPIADVCAEAGTLITQNIRATDPDGNSIVILGYGGPFNLTADRIAYSPPLLPPAFATITPDASRGLPSPATTTFRWQTNCGQLRQEPYLINIKATDIPNNRPPTPLSSYQSFQIQLIGPKPQNLTAQAVSPATGGSRAIRLNWSAYTCLPPIQSGSKDTPKMLIYRKEGCNNPEPNPCQTGILPGYTLVDTVAIGTTTYTDASSTLRRGVSYSYRIVAQYPLPTGGQSVVSLQACVSLPQTAPVLSQVTVDSTDGALGARRGVITVRWTRPLGLNAGDGGGPYQYRLLRAEGVNGTSFSPVAAINTTLGPGVVDTVFVDRGSATQPLTTSSKDYRYRLDFYTTVNGQLTLLEGSEPASSVRLAALGGVNQITLNWQTNTPWSNEGQPHAIFRSRRGQAGPFNQIAVVNVQAPGTVNYVDTGADLVASDGNTSGTLSADSSYCYRVQTVGRYIDVSQFARTGTIRNFSPIQCAAPGDTTRPCLPALTLDLLNCAALAPTAFCNQTSFANKLTWSYPATAGGKACDARISKYNIYYARYQGDSLRLVATVAAPTLTFLHQNLTSVAGCYYVTAVSLRGIESLASNSVCKDICPNYALPNTFTPNGDGKNDVFVALACPSFVERVGFVVYNRWGAKVYESAGPVLSWDGRSSSGGVLPGGVYFYEARVVYGGLVRGGPVQVLKGSVLLIRDAQAMR
ncbi:T9SS type B sorting domain-containing protein [Fibrella aquatilis]|uniref:Gliding motility-associated C-terminal domain-containing protein n=1 Tax=Fibrella aquatilis TaxID=2817059 RepID=A0A939JW01_9BACT|nr:gliding motility-associated C-terminal domain-containing protein [Fibrella aquatilis]MBO0931387.1 gliding motility-associated C-terminal domain-containing protein [Fibrella aquatilis]